MVMVATTKTVHNCLLIAAIEALDENFPGRWLGRRGTFEWPPQSPDLTPVDSSVLGIVKDTVCAQPVNLIE